MAYLVLGIPHLKFDKVSMKELIGTYLTEEVGVECERWKECLVSMNKTDCPIERQKLVERVAEVAAAGEV